MNRRTFLRGSGLTAAGAVIGGATVAGFAADREFAELPLSGHAVGGARPAHLDTITVTYRVRTSRPQVALTFDDGPSAQYTARILDILDGRGVVATFNLIGEHVDRYPDLVRRIAATHEIGNHTWSHPNLSLASARVAERQLARGAQAITAVAGTAPRTFRPPYGYLSGATLMVAAGHGYPVVLWDQRFDRSGESPSANAARIAASAVPGSIILGHDGGSKSCGVVVAGLAELIDRVHDRGFTFVTTSALLAAEERIPAP